MWSRRQQLVTVAILLAWLTPSAVALGFGWHLLTGHHVAEHPHEAEHHQAAAHHPAAEPHHAAEHHHAGDHARQLAALARAATHCHHHDLEIPEHHHDARFDGQAPISRSGPSLVAVLPATIRQAELRAEPMRRTGTRWRGPPEPLFTTHCSLLL